ncbi:MAG: hypothetical protein OXH68_19765 [Gammaproteobacteria bacterium]|nr:hypothetical protein [Gammaproteobacteria bacterium]
MLGPLLAVALAGSGCTTLQSTQLPPDELRDGIRSGSLIKTGDEISVVTTDGREYLLDVRGLDREAIRGLSGGEEAVVAIDDVVALRTHQTESVRTTYAVLGGIGAGGIGGFFLLLVILCA